MEGGVVIEECPSALRLGVEGPTESSGRDAELHNIAEAYVHTLD